jgi:transposase
MVQLTEKQKYEIIILREQNYKINEIADKMNINRKTVMAWINKFQKDNTIERKKGSGRKRKTSDSEDEYIMDIINENNELALIDIKNNLEEADIMISIPTIHRRLIENDYVYKLPVKKPLLTEDYKKKISMSIK